MAAVLFTCCRRAQNPPTIRLAESGRGRKVVAAPSVSPTGAGVR
jgi:hypothetical protein